LWLEPRVVRYGDGWSQRPFTAGVNGASILLSSALADRRSAIQAVAVGRGAWDRSLALAPLVWFNWSTLLWCRGAPLLDPNIPCPIQGAQAPAFSLVPPRKRVPANASDIQDSLAGDPSASDVSTASPTTGWIRFNQTLVLHVKPTPDVIMDWMKSERWEWALQRSHAIVVLDVHLGDFEPENCAIVWILSSIVLCCTFACILPYRMLLADWRVNLADYPMPPFVDGGATLADPPRRSARPLPADDESSTRHRLHGSQ
jgi:hypothetical protein